MKNKTRKVAVFDIDGTIFRSSLLIELVDALWHEGLFPEHAPREYQKTFQLWLERKGSYEDYISAVIGVFERYVRGVRYGDFLRVAERVALFHQHRVYRFSYDLARSLRRKGYYMLAISQSPKTIVDGFCKELGFDKVYGRYYEIDEREMLTGKVVFENLISDKGKILKRAITKGNLALDGSVGVGDTESDISFLNMVERPICFNPNKKLYAYARRKGWEIVVERKDMIYKL